MERLGAEKDKKDELYHDLFKRFEFVKKTYGVPAEHILAVFEQTVRRRPRDNRAHILPTPARK